MTPPRTLPGAVPRPSCFLSGLCVSAALLLLASGCSGISDSSAKGRVQVVDGAGAPLPGAVIYPESEYGTPQQKYSSDELRERSSSAQGVLLIDLDDYFWESDGCYHFRFHKPGYEDETMSVSRDLFPAVLRVDMRPKTPAPTPAARHS